MSRQALPRLPVEPLVAECTRQGLTMKNVADCHGFSTRHVYGGTMTWETADKFAVALGCHPASIWGEQWWAVAHAYDTHPHEDVKGFYGRRKPRSRV